MQPDFNDQECEKITSHALRLLQRGYLSGFNFVHSNSPLPKTAIIVHYLQNDEKQVEGVLNKIGTIEHLKLPRITHYALDPDYIPVKGEQAFRKEYQNAQFTRVNGQSTTLDEVVKNPYDVFLKNVEIDIAIPTTQDAAPSLMAAILTAELSGEKPWFHPAIIAKGLPKELVVPGLLPKDYVSVSRPNAEFYSVVFDETRKNRLITQLAIICKELSGETRVSLHEETVFWHPSQINEKLHEYMKENLPTDIQE